MPTYTLKLKDKLSRKQASDKIHAFAKFSNHSSNFRPKNGKELDLWFKNRGIDPAKIIDECRDPKRHVPEFENLIGSTWTVTEGVSLVDANGEVLAKPDGPGKLIMSNCTAHFEAACAARDRAINENNILAFYEALSQGFASIEALISEATILWNKQGGQPPLTDNSQSKVSLETKLNDWVPILSGGMKIDKSGRNWSDFKKLKKLRDEEAIHPSALGRGVSLKKLAKNLNAFRFGIAFFLGNLHVTLGKQVPAVIINAIYYPDTEVCVASE